MGVARRSFLTSIILPCANRVSHLRATRAQGLWPSSGRVPGGLVLGFCIKLGSDQHNNDREPNPKHKCNDGAERAVGFVDQSSLRTKKIVARRPTRKPLRRRCPK